jgi:hypothetical protein
VTPDELKAHFAQLDEIQPAVRIEYQGDIGIAIELGESLGGPWSSGKILVFWRNGDSTVLPDEFTLLPGSLWEVAP